MYLALAGVVTGLTLYNGAVIAEIVRAGVHALPRGQSEAAWALGLTWGQTMRSVLLPQAITSMLPVLISQLVVVLKDSASAEAVAESSAGGLISAALLAVPGASAYFLGGGVIYTQAARRALLQVPDDAVRGIRSSTEAYARVKARTIRERLGSEDWCVSGFEDNAGVVRFDVAYGGNFYAIVEPQPSVTAANPPRTANAPAETSRSQTWLVPLVEK